MWLVGTAALARLLDVLGPGFRAEARFAIVTATARPAMSAAQMLIR